MFVATLGLVRLIEVYIKLFLRCKNSFLLMTSNKCLISFTGSIRNLPQWIARSYRRFNKQTHTWRPCHKRKHQLSNTATTVRLDHPSSKTIRNISHWRLTLPILTWRTIHKITSSSSYKRNKHSNKINQMLNQYITIKFIKVQMPRRFITRRAVSFQAYTIMLIRRALAFNSSSRRLSRRKSSSKYERRTRRLCNNSRRSRCDNNLIRQYPAISCKVRRRRSPTCHPSWTCHNSSSNRCC